MIRNYIGPYLPALITIHSTFEDDVHILASKEAVLRSRLYFSNVIELKEFEEVVSQFDCV